MSILHNIINLIVSVISHLWYLGIFVWMFLESSFFPFPSEIIMIPAWYLSYKWEMNLYLVIIVWILGSLAGSWFNYLLAVWFGRKFLEKFIKVDKLDKLDKFFLNHGHISTFVGRLIPWVRQYISFPAGLSKMDWYKFTLYTWLGAWIWVVILTLLWYFLWQNQELIHKYLKQITIFTLIFVFFIVLLYYFYNKKKTKW